MNLTKAIQHLFPSAIFGRDFSVKKPADGPAVIERWSLEAPQPSMEVLEEAWAAIEATKEQRATLRAGLISAWESTFNESERALLQPVFEAARAKFDSGDISGAKSIVAGISLTPALNAKRDQILALFPQNA